MGVARGLARRGLGFLKRADREGGDTRHASQEGAARESVEGGFAGEGHGHWRLRKSARGGGTGLSGLEPEWE